ncbi:GtrA family protein [Paracraurococcus lichenis]|uniref:GtrA family protein n=1 Tax=Paracraurococcus lichenis TaxID=3064888 RepID=A0ABT9DWG2_9PROT|nr:GtrA family protein [Paracraurococcus sp. LOR1-02]MDO9708245.1 GtrA family protein [Paracraurococcus sp. LOR1-02]
MTALPLSEHPALTSLTQRLGPARVALLLQFFRFGMVGTIGFLVDAALLLAALALGLGPWLGRVLSYLIAATTTYMLNRAWTFRGTKSDQPVRQWALFLLVNLVGFACNYGTYAALITLVPFVAANPVLGVAAGSVAGLAGNFVLSRRFVFGQGGGGRPSPS